MSVGSLDGQKAAKVTVILMTCSTAAQIGYIFYVKFSATESMSKGGDGATSVALVLFGTSPHGLQCTSHWWIQAGAPHFVKILQAKLEKSTADDLVVNLVRIVIKTFGCHDLHQYGMHGHDHVT